MQNLLCINRTENLLGSTLFVSPEIRGEVLFWQNNIDSTLGSQCHQSPVLWELFILTQLIDTGFGGYFGQCGQDLGSGT